MASMEGKPLCNFTSITLTEMSSIAQVINLLKSQFSNTEIKELG